MLIDILVLLSGKVKFQAVDCELRHGCPFIIVLSGNCDTTGHFSS